MLVAWLIGFIINLIVLYLWKHSYDSYDKERIPVNIIVFIFLVLSAFVPLLNFITGLFLIIVIIVNYAENDLEFHGPKWMTKTIK